MFNYSPRIEHLFVPCFFFVAGEGVRHTSWNLLGWVLYGLGGIAVIMIIGVLIAEVMNNKVYSGPESVSDYEQLKNAPAQVLSVSLTEGSSTKIFHLPGQPRQLEELAKGLLDQGAPFAQRRWTGKGKPFSIDQFNALRDEMLRRGLAYYVSEKDPRQGCDLTRVGKQVLRKYLPSPTTAGLEPVQVDR